MKKVVLLFLMLSMLTIPFLAFASCGNETTSESSSEPEPMDPDYEVALTVAEDALEWIKKAVKSPSTIRVEKIRVAHSKSINYASVAVSFSAQNSFGGTVDEFAVCKMRMSDAGLISLVLTESEVVKYGSAYEEFENVKTWEASDLTDEIIIKAEDYSSLGIKGQ